MTTVRFSWWSAPALAAIACGTEIPAPLGGDGLRDARAELVTCPTGQAPCAGTCCQSAPLAAGSAHSCAINAQGGVACWGWNLAGQLGDGTRADRARPVAVTGLGSGVVALTAGVIHTCALTAAGGVYCWGGGGDGQLGDGRPIGSVESRDIPGSVVGLETGVVAIAATTYTTCAARASGGVVCWGPGGLGNGIHAAASSVPVSVMGLEGGVTGLTAGAGFVCATRAGGQTRVMCWGDTYFGALDNGTAWAETDSPVPSVRNLVSPVALSASERDMCAITSSGAVACWGDDSLGQLGNGGIVPSGGELRTAPVAVDGLGAGVLGLSIGSQAFHMCAWTRSSLLCWGNNSDGQAGRPIADSGVDVVGTPVVVPLPVAEVTSVAIGSEHTCAWAQGKVLCWGSNEVGQLGIAVVGGRSASPVKVVGL